MAWYRGQHPTLRGDVGAVHGMHAMYSVSKLGTALTDDYGVSALLSSPVWSLAPG